MLETRVNEIHFPYLEYKVGVRMHIYIYIYIYIYVCVCVFMCKCFPIVLLSLRI